MATFKPDNFDESIVEFLDDMRLSALETPSTLEDAKAFLDSSSEALVITEAEPPFVILEANESWEQLCGYNKEEVIGRSFRFMQGSETDSRILKELETAILNKQATNVTLMNYHKSGRVFRNFLVVKPLFSTKDGYVTHYLGHLKEIDKEINLSHQNKCISANSSSQ